jgi:molybdate transport system ATP-binding protein
LIEVHIAKDLGNFSLNLSLSLQKSLTVLFGPSGAGKTLTLHTIAGLVEPDSGTIRLDGVV